MDKQLKILEASLTLFVEHGFHNTPTSKIAKEAGVANGTLFYFYPTKDELVKALYIEIKGRMTDYIAEALKNETSFYGIMKCYNSASLHWALKNKTAFRFVEQFNHSPYLNKIAKDEIRKHIEPIINMITKGMKDNILKPMDVDLAFTLISAHTFATNQYLVSKKLSRAEQDQVISKTFELLWNMISIPKK